MVVPFIFFRDCLLLALSFDEAVSKDLVVVLHYLLFPSR